MDQHVGDAEQRALHVVGAVPCRRLLAEREPVGARMQLFLRQMDRTRADVLMGSEPDFFENGRLRAFTVTSPNCRDNAARLRFPVDMQHFQLHGQIGIGEIIDIHLAHVRFLLLIIQLLHLVLHAFMDVDRFFVDQRRRAETVDLADDPAAASSCR